MTENERADRILAFVREDYRARAFALRREGEALPPHIWLRLLLRSLLLEPGVAMIGSIPGPIGIQLRLWTWSLVLQEIGRNCIIESGVRIDGGKNISVSDFVWIDRYVELNALVGKIEIGRRVHIGPYSYILGYGDVVIEDYVGISSYARIYSHSETPRGGLRMSGPMIPERFKSMKTAPVRLARDAFVGTGAVILPGVMVGEGAVVGANAVVHKDVADWTIVGGNPAVPIGQRDPVTVPDL
jgi:galactoside O-acetyltransferase